MLRLPSVKSGVTAPATNAPATDTTPAEQACRAAIRRRRRVIFNNDGDDLFDTPDPATKEGFLSRRMNHVGNTGVDSVFYWYAPATPLYLDPEGKKLKRSAELMKQGTDPLKLAIEACRKHNIEAFWTYRMNDIHDASGSISNWKKEHRHLLMGQPEDQTKYPESNPRWYWTFVDYAHQEVRDLNVAVVREVVNKYDVDGIDLDFLRHPAYFNETRLFQPTTREHLDMLTDMVSEIRKEVLAASKRKGKPILLSVRILPALALNMHFGFDVQRWLKEGYIDLITIGGGYDPFTVTVTVTGKEMIDFGHARGIPVYVCLSSSGFQHAGDITIESWRGASTNAWAAGADGIMTFNLFPELPGGTRRVPWEGRGPAFVRSVWQEMSDPNTLIGKDKLYYIEKPPQAAFNCASLPVEGRLPVTVRKGDSVDRVFPVGDDLPALKDRVQNLHLRIYLPALSSGDVVKVRMNGKPVKASAENPGWLDADLMPSVMEKGFNVLTVNYQDGKAALQTIDKVELKVQYQGQAEVR